MNTRNVTLLLIGLLALTLAGCVSVGNSRPNEVEAYIDLDKTATTKMDVFAKFGQPARVTYDNTSNDSTWKYIYAKVSVAPSSVIPIVGLFTGGTNADTRVATFFFDSTDKFLRVESVSSEVHVGHWDGVTAPAGSQYEKYADEVRQEMFKYNLPFDETLAKEYRGIEVYVDEGEDKD